MFLEVTIIKNIFLSFFSLITYYFVLLINDSLSKIYT